MFVLYIGLNDKNTLKQEITTAAAENIIISAVYKVGIEGYTITPIKGGYKGVTENGFKLELSFVAEEQALAVASRLKKELNQESIGIKFEPDLKYI